LSTNLQFRDASPSAVLLDPMNREFHHLEVSIQQGKISIPLNLTPNESVFVFFPKKTFPVKFTNDYRHERQIPLQLSWNIAFNDGNFKREIHVDSLFDWSQHPNPQIRYYSGTATYTSSFNWSKSLPLAAVPLNLGRVEQLATVYVNQQQVGIVWAPPYLLNIAPYLKKGTNSIEIQVTNTWFNRLLGDATLQPPARQTFTNAPLRFEGKKGQPSGLLGPILIKE
jgi:hypothetical protein